MSTETRTRTFGLTPIHYCPTCKKALTAGTRRKGNQQTNVPPTCQSCGLKLPRTPPSIPHEVFQRFAKLTNGLIRYGFNEPDALFLIDHRSHAKRFLDELTGRPHVDALIKAVGLHYRMPRCAAQHAYNAIRGQKQRKELVCCIAQLFERKIKQAKQRRAAQGDDPAQAIHDVLEWLTDEHYPSKDLVQEVQIYLSSKETVFDTTEVKYYYVVNVLRQVRNLLKRMVQAYLPQTAEGTVPVRELTIPRDHELALYAWFDKETATPTTIGMAFARPFLRTLSSLLTKRVHAILDGKGPLWSEGKLDPLIKTVLNGHSPAGLTRSKWQERRKAWRAETFDSLTNKSFTHKEGREIVVEGLYDMLDALTPKALVSRVFQTANGRFWYGTDLLESWREYLAYHACEKAFEAIVEANLTHFLPLLKRACQDIVTDPLQWSKRPEYTGLSIPLGPDDGRIFRFTPLESGEIVVRVNYASGRSHPFTRKSAFFLLNEPERYYELVDQGYQARKPTLIKRPGRALCLAIPFTAGVPKRSSEPIAYEKEVVGTYDPGIKHFAVAGVYTDVTPVCIPDGATEEEKRRVFYDIDIGAHERARFFVDERSLVGPKTESFFPRSLRSTQEPVSNIKRRLKHLRDEYPLRQKRLQDYRNTHPDYRERQEHMNRKREARRVWQSIKDTHLELTRQIATRLMSFYEHHDVTVIRTEDLRWAQHSSKDQGGNWLAENQLHWFHAQILKHITHMARRKGIRVEVVDARNTSRRCSKCGRLGTRTGKVFTCHHCPSKHDPDKSRQLDSDLNGTRNHAIAPTVEVLT